MGALTESYVDPALAGNVGSGTIGDPWGDVQHALDTVVRDAVNGDRMNIKAGTDEILVAALSLVAYGVPTVIVPLTFQGYTLAAGDGGIGGISGNGNFSIINNAALNAIYFIDLHLHNSGSAAIVNLNNDCMFVSCEVDNTTGVGLDIDDECMVVNCHIHNIGNDGVRCRSTCTIIFNTFENGANNFIEGVDVQGPGGEVGFNVFDLDQGSSGVRMLADSTVAIGNSIFSSSGTGFGIQAGGGATTVIILNNICEGFSGAGGRGVQLVNGSSAILYGYNAFYNNTTNLDNTGDIRIDLSAQDQVLGASPFTDAPNDDFTVKASVQALAYPIANFPNLAVRTYLDIGALQRREAGGGRRSRIRWHGV